MFSLLIYEHSICLHLFRFFSNILKPCVIVFILQVLHIFLRVIYQYLQYTQMITYVNEKRKGDTRCDVIQPRKTLGMGTGGGIFFYAGILEGICHFPYFLPCIFSFGGNHARTRTSQNSLPCHTAGGPCILSPCSSDGNVARWTFFPPHTFTVIWSLVAYMAQVRPMNLIFGILVRIIRKQYFPFKKIIN